jgi:hypothetical protein
MKSVAKNQKHMSPNNLLFWKIEAETISQIYHQSKKGNLGSYMNHMLHGVFHHRKVSTDVKLFVFKKVIGLVIPVMN